MPRKKKDKNYFTQDTENAIVEYNGETDSVKKNLIYKHRLEYSLNKLAENIINTFKFSYFTDTFLDVKHEVVVFMMLNLHKYEQGKGKAFSYFSIVAKNYLILHNNNNYKKTKTHFELDIVDGEREFHTEENQKEAETYNQEFIGNLLPVLDGKLKFIFKHQRDITIADCALQLFRDIDKVENFNKKTLYLLLREMTGAKTQQITRVINTLKIYYIKLSKEFKNTGEITNDNYFTYE